MFKTETMHAAIRKSTISVYRIFMMFILYGVLTSAAAFLIVMGYYVFGTSWVAPLAISPSNDLILQLTGQLVSSQQAMNALVLDRNRLDASLDTMRTQRRELKALDKQLDDAISQQRNSDSVNGPELATLDRQKRKDIVDTEKVFDDVSNVKNEIERDLKVGLITKGDAAQQRTAITQFTNSYTDSKVGEVMMRDNVLQKNSQAVDLVQVLARKADLEAEITQLDINISIGEQQRVSDQTQIGVLQKAIDTAKQSPYYRVSQGTETLNYAFVPYDNRNSARVGTSVFECYAWVVGCYQVGTVQEINLDEQKATHPIWKSDMRGFLVRLELTQIDAAKSKTLFIGKKPFLF